ncbi:RNA polymerase sigma factor [Kineosporia mesophila]|nr:sigma-70 family RNA polymerase sigma factor [Kineosporia mesophila]
MRDERLPRAVRFESLVPGLIEPLRRFLARRTDPATADDVLGETLLTLWRRLDEVPGEPLPWTYGVARNCLANAERTRRRQDRLVARIATIDRPDDTADGTGTAQLSDSSIDLTAVLAQLRPPDAELLRLWAWEELAPAQIAQVLGISANAATIRLHRARERLRAELERTGPGEAEEVKGRGQR